MCAAGTSAQLTVQANDQYDNERGEGGNFFSVRVFLHLLLQEVSMEGVRLCEYFCKNKLSRFKLFENKGT